MDLEYYFKEIKKNMRIYFSECSSKTGLPHFSAQFLIALAEKDDRSLKELSEELFVDKAHTTRAVKLLEKRGYLICRDDILDKRVKRLIITEKGRKTAFSVKADIEVWRKGLFDNFSEKDFINMQVLAVKIYENTDNLIASIGKGDKGDLC